MAQITITVPNTVLPRVVEALCNGDTPTNEKARQEIMRMIKDKVKAYEAQKLARQAFEEAEQNAETNIVLS